MPINSFSVGRDVTLTVVTPTGPLNLTLVTGFQSAPDMPEIRVKGLDGITRHARFFDGWHGSFNIERSDGTIDTYFAGLEASYYAGLNEQPCTITETITESDGSVSQFRYLNVLLKLDDAGHWAGDQTVKMTISFVAARRIKV